MKAALMLTFLAAAAVGQNTGLTVTMGLEKASVGEKIYLPVTIDAKTGSLPSSLQWTFRLPDGVEFMDFAAGAAALAANKQIQCNRSNYVCTVTGLNQNLIGSGVVGYMILKLSKSFTKGVVRIGNLYATTPDGYAITSLDGRTGFIETSIFVHHH
jgi:hypothetical protein